MKQLQDGWLGLRKVEEDPNKLLLITKAIDSEALHKEAKIHSFKDLKKSIKKAQHEIMLHTDEKIEALAESLISKIEEHSHDHKKWKELKKNKSKVQ